jgi:hypothetical protein
LEIVMNTIRAVVKSGLLASALVLAACSMVPWMSSSVALGARLTGAHEVPATTSTGSGTVEASLDKDSKVLTWTITYAGLTGPVTAGHFHGPALPGQNAGVALPLKGDLTSPISGSATLSSSQEADLLAGKWYVNLHTAANPGGKIRGQMMAR